jgi:nucleoside-diphosphate-sugar epimerase
VNILVTGAAGFLGSHIVERLCARHHPYVRCLVRDLGKADRLRELAEQYPETTLDIVVGDLKYARDALIACQGCDVVIHAAAAMKGSAAELFMDSVVASRNLLDAVITRPSVRVALVSSFSVLGAADLPRGAILDEAAPLERHPEWRDVYSHAKLRQELLFWEYRKKYDMELVVLRPGVIYGPGASAFSNRVGLRLFGVFFHLGGKNLLPLSFVENCADAVVVAALSPGAEGNVYHIVDDDLLSSKQFLARYANGVKRISSVRLPYPALMLISRAVSWYSGYSEGQLPPVFTPYKTRTMWGGNRFSNAKLHSLGWTQRIPTEEALRQFFASLRQLD